eukprot:2313693-Prorocentrum_lima.AAC.1
MGWPEPPKDKKGHPEEAPDQQDQHDFASLSSILGALMWIAIRICWSVTRVSSAVRANELSDD